MSHNGNHPDQGDNPGKNKGDKGGGGRYQTIPVLDDYIFNVVETSTYIGAVTGTDGDKKDILSYSFANGTQETTESGLNEP